jgi:hypothetical protein
MVCEYLVKLNNIVIKVVGDHKFYEKYADKIGCCASSYQCPKKRLILNISPQCWRFKSTV